MSKTLKEFKKDLKEAVASKADIQYVAAKTDKNDHFEARRYIADKILGDKKLADAYKALEMIHVTYGRIIGGDAVTLRQRLEKMLYDDLKRKVSNWSDIHGAL